MTTSVPGTQEIPSNIYKPNNPFEATVLEHRRLTAPDSPNDVVHIIFDISQSELSYWDGQSIGILPPGTDANGKPHKLRLYSIASPSYGDDGHYKTVTVCVKRAVSEGFPPGVCSSFLCDLKPGDTVKLTGPVGKAFLLPFEPDANLIMVATGTGIAPFRAFLKTRYEKRASEKGVNRLIFGCQTMKDFLYQDEFDALLKNHGDTFEIISAISREQKNAEGGRMYVQHRLCEHAEALFNLLKDNKTYFYMCGLRGMEAGVMEGMAQAAASQNINWDDFLAQLKSERRWHVEVY